MRRIYAVYNNQEGVVSMTAEVATHKAEGIGAVAGAVWQFLESSGPVTLSKLAREIDAPRDMVMQGVGWLAREGKIEFQEGPRSKLVTLV